MDVSEVRCEKLSCYFNLEVPLKERSLGTEGLDKTKNKELAGLCNCTDSRVQS